MKMGKEKSSEKAVTIYQSTRCHIPEDSPLSKPLYDAKTLQKMTPIIF
jgi:hypothetical protein